MPVKAEVLTKPQQDFLLQRINQAQRGQYGDRKIQEPEKPARVAQAEKEKERAESIINDWREKSQNHTKHGKSDLAKERDKAKQEVLFAKSSEAAINAVQRFENWCDANLE